MKKSILILLVSVMMMSCFLGKNLILANGESKETPYQRYYTNIQIREEDSLWEIARIYNKNSGMDIRDYIKEVKVLNGMVGNSIKAGDFLAIVYFAEAPLDAESLR